MVMEGITPDVFRKVSLKISQKIFDKLIAVLNMWLKSKIFGENVLHSLIAEI